MTRYMLAPAILLLTACAASTTEPSSALDEVYAEKRSPPPNCDIGMACVKLVDRLRPEEPCTCVDQSAVRRLPVWPTPGDE
jgi:hypothetical protein